MCNSGVLGLMCDPKRKRFRLRCTNSCKKSIELGGVVQHLENLMNKEVSPLAVPIKVLSSYGIRLPPSGKCSLSCCAPTQF